MGVGMSSKERYKKRPQSKLKTGSEFPCDVCKKDNYLVEHHIEGRGIPNANHPSNLCMICQNCHYLVHLGEVIVERWVMTSGGMELMWHKKGEASFTGDKAIPHIIKTDS